MLGQEPKRCRLLLAWQPSAVAVLLAFRPAPGQLRPAPSGWTWLKQIKCTISTTTNLPPSCRAVENSIEYQNFVNSKVQTAATKGEQIKLNEREAENQAIINETKTGAQDYFNTLYENANGISELLLKRIPIPLNLLNSKVNSFNNRMTKAISRFNNTMTIKQNYNTSFIDLSVSTAKTDAATNKIINSVLEVLNIYSDLTFNDNSKFIACSLFMPNNLVLNGNLTAFTRSSNPSDTVENIQLEIEKDYNFLYNYKQLKYNKQEKNIEKVEILENPPPNQPFNQNTINQEN